MNDDIDDQLDGPILDPADDAAVTALLAGLPEVAMPDDVAERLAAALAAEVPLSGAVPPWAAGGATNVSVLPSQRERDQRKATRRARVLSAAAGLVLVLGAVAFGTQFFQSDNDSGTTPPERAARRPRAANGGGQASAEATLLTSSGHGLHPGRPRPQGHRAGVRGEPPRTRPRPSGPTRTAPRRHPTCPRPRSATSGPSSRQPLDRPRRLRRASCGATASTRSPSTPAPGRSARLHRRARRRDRPARHGPGPGRRLRGHGRVRRPGGRRRQLPALLRERAAALTPRSPAWRTPRRRRGGSRNAGHVR